MAEENQVMKELQQGPEGPTVPTVMKELQRVTTKNLKKVEAGKRLAVHNRRREEQRKEQVKLEKPASGINQYYGIGAVIVLGAIGGLRYYIYRTKKGEQPSSNPQQNNPKPHPQVIVMQLQTNKFEMD